MFRSWKKRRKLARALKLYDRGLFEEALAALPEVDEKPDSASLYRAAILFSLGKYDEAKSALMHPGTTDSTALQDYVLGRIEAARGNWERALELAKTSFSKDSFNTRIEHFLAICLLQKGEIEQAADHFENVIRFDRKLVDSRLLLMAEMAILEKTEGKEIHPSKPVG